MDYGLLYMYVYRYMYYIIHDSSNNAPIKWIFLKGQYWPFVYVQIYFDVPRLSVKYIAVQFFVKPTGAINRF